jgi:hypothetical protein
MIRTIRTRSQLIQYVRERLPLAYKSIHRAMAEGTIENLGGFRAIPPADRPGWIVDVTSNRSRTWHVAVEFSALKQWMVIEVVDVIPWESKMESSDPLYAGDKLIRASCGENHEMLPGTEPRSGVSIVADRAVPVVGGTREPGRPGRTDTTRRGGHVFYDPRRGP